MYILVKNEGSEDCWLRQPYYPGTAWWRTTNISPGDSHLCLASLLKESLGVCKNKMQVGYKCMHNDQKHLTVMEEESNKFLVEFLSNKVL